MSKDFSGFKDRSISRRSVLKIMAAAGASGALPGLLRSGLVDAKVKGDRLVVAHVEEVGSFDPKIWGGFSAIYVQAQLYDTLMRQDPVTGDLKPGLALKWEHPDPLTYRYMLRKEARFHDGTPVRAEDVAFTFNRVADPEEGAWEQYLFVNVDKAVVLDEFTVEVKMKRHDHQYQFIGYFEGGNILSKAYTEKVGDEIGTKPIGSGPYRLADRDPSTIVLEAFEGYWEGPSKIKRIEFRNIKDSTTIIAGLQRGDIHLSYDVPLDQAGLLERMKNVEVQTAPGWEHTLLHMSNRETSPFHDPLVRRAIRYAIDTGAALAAFDKKYIKPAYGAFIPENVPYNAFNETEDTYKPDLNKAKELLAKSSKPNGFQAKVAVNPGVRYETLAVAFQQQLKPLKIDLQIQRLPAPDTIALAYSHDFDMIQMYWIADYTDISSFLLQWHSPNAKEFGPNFTEYKNPEYDKQFERALYTLDKKELEEAFKECQRILTRDQPSIVCAFPQTVRFQSSQLGGAPVAPVYVYDRYADLHFKS